MFGSSMLGLQVRSSLFITLITFSLPADIWHDHRTYRVHSSPASSRLHFSFHVGILHSRFFQMLFRIQFSPWYVEMFKLEIVFLVIFLILIIMVELQKLLLALAILAGKINSNINGPVQAPLMFELIFP